MGENVTTAAAITRLEEMEGGWWSDAGRAGLLTDSGRQENERAAQTKKQMQQDGKREDKHRA